MARINHYDQGDTWTPQATFTVNGVATDPTNITARTKDPSGTVTILGPVSGATGGSGITRVSAGVYTITVTLNDAGYWYARFEGTGTAAGAVEHEAIVDPSEFYESAQLSVRALVGVAEAKDWLQQQNIDTSNDLELARVINDVSDRLMQEAGREFKPESTAASARTFLAQPFGPPRPWYIDGTYMGDLNPGARTVFIGDLAATPTLVEIINYSDWSIVDETIASANIAAHPLVRQSWEPIRWLEFSSSVTRLSVGQRVRVTGVWGFPSIPGSIRQACLDAVAWIMDRDVEHYRQDLGNTAPERGAVIMVGSVNAPRIVSLPPAALAAAWAFRDPALA